MACAARCYGKEPLGIRGICDIRGILRHSAAFAASFDMLPPLSAYDCTCWQFIPLVHPCRPSVAQDGCSILQYKKNIYKGVYMLLKNLVGGNTHVHARAHKRLHNICLHACLHTYMSTPRAVGRPVVAQADLPPFKSAKVLCIHLGELPTRGRGATSALRVFFDVVSKA